MLQKCSMLQSKVQYWELWYDCMYTLYYGRYWLVSNIYKNLVSFTYFAVMEDLDKNVFFCVRTGNISTV